MLTDANFYAPLDVSVIAASALRDNGPITFNDSDRRAIGKSDGATFVISRVARSLTRRERQCGV
jgi:hypothetical protein